MSNSFRLFAGFCIALQAVCLYHAFGLMASDVVLGCKYTKFFLNSIYFKLVHFRSVAQLVIANLFFHLVLMKKRRNGIAESILLFPAFSLFIEVWYFTLDVVDITCAIRMNGSKAKFNVIRTAFFSIIPSYWFVIIHDS